MKLDYRKMRKYVEIRMKQIEDKSLELYYFCDEYNELQVIKKSLTNLMIIERRTVEEYENLKHPKHPQKPQKPQKPKESNPET